jgi:Major Facilitator Superfamily
MVALFVRGLPRGVYVLQAGYCSTPSATARPTRSCSSISTRSGVFRWRSPGSRSCAGAALAASLVGGSLTDRFGGRRTMIGGLALSTIAFAQLVAAEYAFAVLLAAIALFSVAECLYDAVQGPIVADLAPDGLVGRYLALNGLS